jgi:iron complex transport system substrate-binding protein
MVRVVGALVGRAEAGDRLAEEMEAGLERIRESARALPRRPRMFFEEWDDPLISGIKWVDELIDIAGGDPIFPELRDQPLAKGRIVDPAVVAARDPEAIVASWCGKAVRRKTIEERPGWSAVSAVRDGHIYEIKSTYILQPGPASLTEGVRQLHDIVNRVIGRSGDRAIVDRRSDDRAIRRSIADRT